MVGEDFPLFCGALVEKQHGRASFQLPILRIIPERKAEGVVVLYGE